jgi:hypothetical protein
MLMAGRGQPRELAAVPAVGPWLAVGLMDVDAGLKVGFALSGIGQLVGLGMFAYGVSVVHWGVEVEHHAMRMDLGVTGDKVTLGGSF